MKKIVFGLIAVTGGACCFMTISGAAPEDTIRPNTKVGPIDVGGLTPDQAAKNLRIWWESEKLIRLKVSAPVKNLVLPDAKPGELGVTLDDQASVSTLPIGSGNSEDGLAQSFPLIFKLNGEPLTQLKTAVSRHPAGDSFARAFFKKGAIYRHPEVTGAELDVEALPALVGKAVLEDGTVTLPLREGAKHVTDEQLKKIKDVVAQFSTRFSARNRPRSANIKLAASKIDGLVLLPGEKFSFNGTVGKRTAQAGFQLAGVYKNGQHDTGIGGGICQVSTTLYNSALLANLKVRSRSNHSLPVPYVPLGRDATVDYGNLDLVFENTYNTPIALATKYSPGRLTFWILGQKQTGLVVKVEGEGLRSWSVPQKQVTDATLPVGKTRVVRPGSIGQSVRTYRLVFQNGKLVKKEPLGFSQYGGDSKIVAVGTAPAPEQAGKVAPVVGGTSDAVVTPPAGRPVVPHGTGG